jgi:2-polyprenyl-6-hydroxyphenyl methylase/3-demethylubiquinone-9 3-methyltransferase
MECGCGTGIFTRGLAESGAQLTAVDISEDLLEIARAECTAPNITFFQADLEAPALLPQGHFDAICGISVLHHLDMPKALPGIRKCLRKDGRFAFSEPNLANPLNKYYYFVNDEEKRQARGTSPTEMAFRAKELRDCFEQAGFVVEGLAFRDFMHPDIPARLIPLARSLEALAEALPLVRAWSGSLWIWGRNPA